MGKSNKPLTLRTSEDWCTETGTWVEGRSLTPSSYENCHKATAQPQTWVSWGNELTWIHALLKGLGSHLFFHRNQRSQRQRQAGVLCTLPDGHSGGTLGLLGPSRPKREAAMDMKDGQSLAPWRGERGLQPVLPYTAPKQTPSLSTKLRSGICFGQGVGGLRAIGPAGILGDLEIAFGYRLGNTVQMRTLHFFPTWSCCNSSTQTLGLGRKEQTKMCSSFVLVFLEGAVPIWRA